MTLQRVFDSPRVGDVLRFGGELTGMTLTVRGVTGDRLEVDHATIGRKAPHTPIITRITHTLSQWRDAIISGESAHSPSVFLLYEGSAEVGGASKAEGGASATGAGSIDKAPGPDWPALVRLLDDAGGHLLVLRQRYHKLHPQGAGVVEIPETGEGCYGCGDGLQHFLDTLCKRIESERRAMKAVGADKPPPGAPTLDFATLEKRVLAHMDKPGSPGPDLQSIFAGALADKPPEGTGGTTDADFLRALYAGRADAEAHGAKFDLKAWQERVDACERSIAKKGATPGKHAWWGEPKRCAYCATFRNSLCAGDKDGQQDGPCSQTPMARFMRGEVGPLPREVAEAEEARAALGRTLREREHPAMVAPEVDSAGGPTPEGAVLGWLNAAIGAYAMPFNAVERQGHAIITGFGPPYITLKTNMGTFRVSLTGEGRVIKPGETCGKPFAGDDPCRLPPGHNGGCEHVTPKRPKPGEDTNNALLEDAARASRGEAKRVPPSPVAVRSPYAGADPQKMIEALDALHESEAREVDRQAAEMSITIPEELIKAEEELGPPMACSPETLKRAKERAAERDRVEAERAKASPRPWSVGLGWEQQDPGVYIADAKGGIVYAPGDESDPTNPATADDVQLSEANARLIVDAVNAHDERIRFFKEMTEANDPSAVRVEVEAGKPTVTTCARCGETRERCGCSGGFAEMRP